MDGDQARPDSLMQIVHPDLSWVADEPRETASIFVGCGATGHKDLFLEVEDPSILNWEVRIPTQG
ncbi:hypothetical protein A2U01_0047300, partial [Trifolium medium]|nr:hypothetical protein [Trifolium medium]